MKILHSIDGMNIGGVQDLIFNLHKYDRDNVHSVWAYRGSLSPETDAAGMITWEGGPDENAGYEVLVGHGVGGWSYNDTFRWAKDRGMKTVEVMHSVARSLTDPTLCDYFVGISELALEQNPQFSRRGCIYAMVPPELFDVEPEGPYIGRISRIVEEKRPWEFVELADIFTNEKFTLAGDGNLRSRILASAPLNLFMPGMLRNFPEFFRELKLFVFPTKDEACCISVAMAQAAGVPVICQDIAPLRETTGGHAVFCNTKSDYYVRVLDFIAEPDNDRWVTMATDARDWANSKFHPEMVTAQWHQLLNSL